MSDATLTISIEAQDDFSAAFQQVLESLNRVGEASGLATAGVTALSVALASGDALDVQQRQVDLMQQQVLAAGQLRDVSEQAARQGRDILARDLLPPVGRSAYRGYTEGGRINAFLESAGGIDMQGAAANLSGLTGLDLSAGMLGGGIGAGLALLMQNPEMQKQMARLNDLLQQLITPIAEAIGPSLEALAPLMLELKPVFVLIGEVLRTELHPIVEQLQLASAAVHSLESALQPLEQSLEDLKSSFENLGNALGIGPGSSGGFNIGIPGVGSVGTGGVNIGGVQLFDEGGLVGPLSGPAPLGLPGHRLVLAQVGERMIPPGRQSGGAPAAGSSAAQSVSATVHIHDAFNPDAVAEKVRRVIEQLNAQGKLRLS